MPGLHGAPAISGIDGGSGTGLLSGIAPDHLPALFAPLVLPVAIWMFLTGVRRAANAGCRPAARFLRGYEAASPVRKTAATLLLGTGFIHLGLVPGHAQEAPALARLFAINGALFVLAAIASFVVRWWRPATVLLLLLTVLAYLIAVVNGTESVDQLGIATKLVELTALGLVLLPGRTAVATRGRSVRRAAAAAALVCATVVTGVGVWGAEIKAHAAEAAAVQDEHGIVAHHRGVDPTGMVMQPVPTRAPTQQEQMAALKLSADTKAGIAKYENVQVALADGYRPSILSKGPLVHYANKAYTHDGRLLDPTRPEALVYANTSHGPVLLGAMYMTEKMDQAGPNPAGPLVQWHRHANICFAPPSAFGLPSPFGTCPAGTIGVFSSAMLHVWTIDGAPSLFAAELDPAFVKRITGK